MQKSPIKTAQSKARQSRIMYYLLIKKKKKTSKEHCPGAYKLSTDYSILQEYRGS